MRLNLAQIRLTGPNRIDLGRAHTGFTLIELVMVITLVGVMFTIAMPRINVVRFQVSSGAQEIQSAITASRGQALLRQHDMVLTFDVSEDRLNVLNDANNNGITDTGEFRRVVELSESVKFDRGGAPAINGATNAVSFTKVSESLPALEFHRNGSASEEGTIYITSIRGAGKTTFPQYTRALRLERSTGTIRCYSYRTLNWEEGC